MKSKGHNSSKQKQMSVTSSSVPKKGTRDVIALETLNNINSIGSGSNLRIIKLQSPKIR